MSAAELEGFDTGLTPEDVDPDRPEPLPTPWGTFALFRVAGRIYCVEAFCPHLSGPLFAGTLTGATITCPWHLWRYDLATGARLSGDGPSGRPDARPLLRCAVELGPRGTLVLAPPV